MSLSKHASELCSWLQRSEAETQKLNGRLEKTEQAHNNLMRILTAAAKDPSILSCLVTSASSERLVIEGGATTGEALRGSADNECLHKLMKHSC